MTSVWDQITAGHGGQLQNCARYAGCEIGELLDFSVNVNPLGTPASVITALRTAITTIAHYPDSSCHVCTQLLADYLHVDPQRIVIGNGAEQLIWWLPNALHAQRVLIATPSYADYQRAAAIWDRPVVQLPLTAADDYVLDPYRWAGIVQPHDLVWIGQPNNPTGQMVALEPLQAMIEAYPQVWWALDEAFVDFAAPIYSTTTHWNAANLVIVRSLTKMFALAGLRLGYALAPPMIAAKVRRVLPDWSVNHLAQIAGQALFCDPALVNAFIEQTRNLIETERTWLEQQLQALQCKVYPSSANYLLVRIPQTSLSATQFKQQLLQKFHIAVRCCQNYPGLDAHMIRIAVRNHADNQRLIEAWTHLSSCA
jgi:L-threonine-O-3-phosphate decarboxylase